MIIENKFLNKNLSAANDADDKSPVRCAECDREMDHYVTFMSSINVDRHICWECLGREEKGFNAKRGFHREARNGNIPR